MGLRKCPKCELNYIKDDEKLCHICLGAKAKHDDDLQTLCSECGENTVFKGSDLCIECLKEKRRRERIKSMCTGISPQDLTLNESNCLQNITVSLEEKDLETLQNMEDDEEMEEEDEEEEMEKQFN